jgi:stress response protein YsnF
MASHDIDTVLGWRGSTVVDRDGEKIGTFEELYLDQGDRPAWAAVKTGLFGMRQTFVPLSEAEPVEQGLQVPYDKDQVKAAPNIDPETQLTDDEEEQLHRHYGLSAGTAGDEPGAPGSPGDERAAQDDEVAGADAEARRDEDVGGHTSASAEAVEREAVERGPEGDAPEVTRSEEELIVGTRKRVRGRARLKKYVVTDHVQRTVPVKREEVRVEYDPPEAGDDARDDR